MNNLKFKTCRKIATLLFLGALSSASSQVVLDCNFTLFVFNEYGCILDGITVLDPSASNITFTGQHIGNRTNEDVEIVEIVNSNTPFIISQIFSTFQNLIELEVRSSGLQSISLPDNIRLQYLTLFGNNISRIENGTFRHQNNLAIISLNSNHIQEVEEDAFEGQENLASLSFINNNIREILPRTLDPLINVFYLDFERNNLTRIGEGMLSQMGNLFSLYFDYNQINFIHPQFVETLPVNVQTLGMVENACINQRFTPNTEQSRQQLSNALESCFRNFEGAPRNVTMEFSGPMTLFDSSGRVIARV